MNQVIRRAEDLEIAFVARDLEILQNRFGRAARVLDPGDVGVAGKTARGFGFDVVLGARRDVVEVDRITSYNVCYTKLLRHRRLKPVCPGGRPPRGVVQKAAL